MIAHRNDGRFKPCRAWPGIQHERRCSAQAVRDVPRTGRADTAAAVGRRCREKQPACLQHRLHHRVRGAAQRDGRQPGGHRRSHRGGGLQRQHQRQRPGPEADGKRRGAIVELREPFGGGVIGHMHDQRVEVRPPLDAIDIGHRVGIRCVGREAINRLGGNRDNATGAQGRGRLCHGGGVGLRYPAMS